MSPTAQIGMLLINTISSIVLLVVILRFLLQLVRADFYNPVSQFIVKFTNPVLIPLRRAIPGFAGLDIASLVLAYVLQLIFMAITLFIIGFPVPWANLLIWALIALPALILNIYFWGLIITVIASWIAPGSYNPVLILLNQILEPVVRPIRAVMPDMGGLDLSPIAIFLTIQIVEIAVIKPLAAMAQMPSGLVMGL